LDFVPRAPPSNLITFSTFVNRFFFPAVFPPNFHPALLGPFFLFYLLRTTVCNSPTLVFELGVSISPRRFLFFPLLPVLRAWPLPISCFHLAHFFFPHPPPFPTPLGCHGLFVFMFLPPSFFFFSFDRFCPVFSDIGLTERFQLSSFFHWYNYEQFFSFFPPFSQMTFFGFFRFSGGGGASFHFSPQNWSVCVYPP